MLVLRKNFDFNNFEVISIALSSGLVLIQFANEAHPALTIDISANPTLKELETVFKEHISGLSGANNLPDETGFLMAMWLEEILDVFWKLDQAEEGLFRNFLFAKRMGL